MLDTYIPTIEKPTRKHADWYRGFCNAFNLCQLSNLLFIQYLENSIQTSHKINTSDAFTNSISNLDIADFLKGIVKDCLKVNETHQNLLLCMGVEVHGFHNKEVSMNLDEIKKSTTEENWIDIIKGLINVFEFLYLFAIVENHLKLELNEKKTAGLIGKALKKYRHSEKTEIDFAKHLETEYKLSRDFLIKLWGFFLEFRNICSHSFGHIQKEDKERVLNKRDKFISAYKKLSIEWNFSPLEIESYFFPSEKIILKKMYLINDIELNFFRNFIRIFIPELAKWNKKI